MKSSTEIVTPARAAEWLERNSGNRRIRKFLVNYIAKEILNGEWRSDHPSPVCFDFHGNLMDGQHRLLAIVQAGKEVQLHVVRGLDPEVRKYIDTGIVRRLEDQLTLDFDPVLNKSIAAMVRLHWHLHCGRGFSNRPSPCEAKEIFREHQSAFLFAASAIRSNKSKVCRGVIKLTIAEYFERDAKQAEAFVSSIMIPDGPIQQARLLRDWLLRQPPGGGAAIDQYIYNRAVYCMQAHLESFTISRVYEAVWK